MQKRTRKKQHLHTETGAALVDAAITVPLLVLLVFGLLDASRTVYNGVALQFVLNKTVRWASTGQAYVAPPVGSASSLDCGANRTNEVKCYAEDLMRTFGIQETEHLMWTCSMTNLSAIDRANLNATPCSNADADANLVQGNFFALVVALRTYTTLPFFSQWMARRALGRVEYY